MYDSSARAGSGHHAAPDPPHLIQGWRGDAVVQGGALKKEAANKGCLCVLNPLLLRFPDRTAMDRRFFRSWGGTSFFQQLPILHRQHERRRRIGCRRSLEVESVASLRHQARGNRPGHGKSDVRTFLFDIVFAAGNMQLGRAGRFDHISFHLQRHTFDYAPDFVLIFGATGGKHKFPFTEWKLLNLVGSFAVHNVMRLLRWGRRNVFRNLSTPVGWRTRGGLRCWQHIVGPTFFRAVVVFVNASTVLFDLIMRRASWS